MSKSTKRIIASSLLLLLAWPAVLAQKTLDVAKFERMDNDLMARVTKPVRDKDEGKLCALIRVATELTGLEFRADALGIVKQEQHSGEVWLYVPYGARSISFTHEGYFPLLYQYALPIEEGTVYELHLASYDVGAVAATQSVNTQMFVLTHSPDQATVFVDEMEVPTEHGVFAAMMNKGEHSYRVQAEQYEEASGDFVLADQPLRETVTLQPLFATFQLFTLPENDFDVFVNGQRAGVSPYKSERLEPGAYRVHIEKKDFYPVDTLLRLREGDNVSLTCRLTSFADSLFYNRELGGRRLSFGVNVGYLAPFVSTSAGGGFHGSMVNYGLGNSQENTSYEAQSGFSAGIAADVKLYKNLYLVTGLNYSQYKYTNKFRTVIPNVTTLSTGSLSYIGDQAATYEENYTVRTLELPVMASYRFVLTKYASLHLNLGPWVSYALSGKMKFSGSAETSGQIYGRMFGQTDYDHPQGTFSSSDHLSGDFDLFAKHFTYVRTTESGMGLSSDSESSSDFGQSPYRRLNYGLRLAANFELRGFQLGVGYSLMLSNMADKRFFEGNRIMTTSHPGENAMSGYKHRIHSLEIRLGYMLRY